MTPVGRSAGGASVERVWIPLGSAVTVVAAVVTGVKWVSEQVEMQNEALRSTLRTDFSAEISALRKDVGEMGYEIRGLQSNTEDGWTKNDHVNWALQLGRLNPNIVIPEDK